MPEPYEYQKLGTQLLRRNDAFMLADDMGVGKTMQLLLALRNSGLAIVPPSLKYSWRDECQIWRPDLTPIVMQGTGLGCFKWPNAGELVIAGYNQMPDWLNPPPASSGYAHDNRSKAAKLRRKELKLERAAFNAFCTSQEKFGRQTTVIYDEAQSIKNPKSTRSRKARILSALCERVWLSTGTPMPRGNPDDTWGIFWAAQMENLVFGNFNTFQRVAGYRFGKDPRNPSGPQIRVGAKPTLEFHSMISRYMLRRRIEDIAPWLPARSDRVLTIDLAAETEAIMSGVPSEIIDAIRNAKTGVELDRIREMPGFQEFSARRKDIARLRIPAMLDYVENAEDNELRTIVFSAHREPIEALANREGWAVIHGGIGQAEKQEIVRNQANYIGVGITIKSGGAGLNLGTFHNSLFVDQDWDYTMNAQAKARTYRVNSNDGNPRMYNYFTSDCEVDRLVTEKQISAAENISIGIDGL